MLKKVIFMSSMLWLSQNTLANIIVEMETSMGAIEIELFDKQAPISTNNFKHYIKQDFYNDTLFHRVIPNFMIQGGGMLEGMVEKPNARATITNEANNGLKNERGTLAMARTQDPHSARSQFFINVENNSSLNYNAFNQGYAVFGRVTKGMNVVDQIVNVPTKSYGMHANVPAKNIKILSVKIKAADK